MDHTVLLLAYDRPDYLSEVVAALRNMRGLERWHVVASIDQRPDGTHNPEVVELCKSITPDVRLRPRLDCNKHVRVALTELYEQGVEQLLYIEDDIIPASDCLEFCEEMVPVMASLPRIKVAALLGQNHGDVHVAYRNRQGFKAHRWFNAWGNFYLRAGLGEILRLWPESWDSSGAAWDALVNAQIIIDHEFLALVPLLSRIKNIGVVGRYCRGIEDYKGRVRDYWSNSDFSRPIGSDWH